MKKIIKLFRLRREERLPALVALVYAVVMNAMMIARYYDLFSQAGRGKWTIFVKNFIISGFDAITYSMVTSWEAIYNVYRHPLLSFFVWPLSMLNKWLTPLIDINLVQFIVAVPLVFCAFYSFIFLLRTFRYVVGLAQGEAFLLTSMFFSFGYIMLTVSVPDHFCPSMFLLTLSIYIAGMKLKNHREFTLLQTVVLFFLTAGVTLSNGIKTFLYALFTNGRRFFRPKYLLLGVLLPSLAIWIFARWEYRTFVLPREKARKAVKVKKDEANRQKALVAFMDTTTIKDTAQAVKTFDSIMQKRAEAKEKARLRKPLFSHMGKPMGKGEFTSWTDGTTSRLQTAIENLFGESLQLHQDHLLMDTLRSRPVIVHYRWALSYVVEGLVLLLFVAGVWCGRGSRFLWMVLSGFAFDMVIHIVLGFAINEVYIMAAHWAFALPIAMGYLFTRNLSRRSRLLLRSLIAVLTLYLFIYNFTLYAGYLL